MSSYKIYLTQTKIKEWILILVLLFSLIITFIYALSKKSEVVLIGIDQNGTRIITTEDDPILKTEIINFLRTFVSLSYNFDQDTFTANAGKYSDLLSLELWNQKKNDVVRAAEEIKKEPMQLSTIIKKIAKEKNQNNNDVYKVYTTQTVTRRARSETLSYVISFEVKKIDKRTKENPYGIEITALDERRLESE